MKTFRRIIMWLCRRHHLQEASQLLEKLELTDQKTEGEGLLNPDCYQLVIEAWQASTHPEKDDFIKLHSKAKLKQLGIGS